MGFRIWLMSLATAALLHSGWSSAETIKPAPPEKAKNGATPKKDHATKKAGTAEPRRTRLVLLPADQASDGLGKGCWVRFYDDKNFKGDDLTVVGPADFSNMRFHHRFSWGGPASLIAGPKAKVLIYEAENFKARSGAVNPGQQAKDLSDRTTGLFEDIQSPKITCAP